MDENEEKIEVQLDDGVGIRELNRAVEVGYHRLGFIVNDAKPRGVVAAAFGQADEDRHARVRAGKVGGGDMVENADQ